MFTRLIWENIAIVDVPSSSVVYVYLSFIIRWSYAYSCTYLHSVHTLTSDDLYMSRYLFAIYDIIYSVYLGVTDEYLNATAPEIHEEEESPRHIAEWTSDDVF